MTQPTLSIESAALLVLIDPGRGSDILSIIHKKTGTEALFSTPWRDRADDIREGRSGTTTAGSMETWLEQYRGGWQTLCPNAGAARSLNGAPLGYHGEASASGWRVVDYRASGISLTTALFSVPLFIHRDIEVDANTVRVTDTLTNLSQHRIQFDYAHHPAFGGGLLEGPCTIETGAATFVNDFEAGAAGIEPNSRHDWPFVIRQNGDSIDLSMVPDGPGRSVFGWLTDFAEHSASVTNHQLGITARLDWDGTHLPFAWLWCELNSSANWPWYGRARVIAIEPSSTPTSGPSRVGVIDLEAGGRLRLPISLTVSARS